MKFAIIGGGLTGLTAAYELTKKGHEVTVYEKQKTLGGLARGFKEPIWEWHLDYAYHHFFTNDSFVYKLLKELKLDHTILIKRPVTSTYYGDAIHQFDSPLHLLTYSPLPIVDRLRTGIMIGLCKINPFWKPLEHFTAQSLFKPITGEKSWKLIWHPLLVGKFHSHTADIAASWLWARIYKRTPKLGYIKGGFQTLTEGLAKKIRNQGGIIQPNTEIHTIRNQSNKKYAFKIRINNTWKQFHKVLITTPSSVLESLIPQLPKNYINNLKHIPHLDAQMLILATKKPILKDIYWLNINNRSFPFLAAVAHTNFIDKKHYGGMHLSYFGNYLPSDHNMLKLSKTQLITKFMPYIQKLNPSFKKSSIIKSYMFIGSDAQPVHTIDYSKQAPPFNTPMKGLYLANMDSIYPWDRGTNYAIELGKKVAKKLL
ncbi:FAD-dependent oxidoreductase [Patescibacteria group bacterium]